MTETDITISDETDKRIGLNCFCVLFLNDLYEHHCYRKYSDKLDEYSEGFFWEEFYHTDSEQGSDSYFSLLFICFYSIFYLWVQNYG